MDYFFETPPMKIGKHEWRCVVMESAFGGRSTLYQYRRAAYKTGDYEHSAGRWQDQRSWPRYNINDGLFLGLPKSLQRLYSDHEAEIKAHLGQRAEGQTPTTQMSLF